MIILILSIIIAILIIILYVAINIIGSFGKGLESIIDILNPINR